MAESPERLKQIANAFWRTRDIRKLVKNGLKLSDIEYNVKEDYYILKPSDTQKKRLYNRVPVCWCSVCKSLAIIDLTTKLNEDIDSYCSQCYSTSIVTGSIEEWLINNK